MEEVDFVHKEMDAEVRPRSASRLLNNPRCDQRAIEHRLFKHAVEYSINSDSEQNPVDGSVEEDLRESARYQQLKEFETARIGSALEWKAQLIP